MGGYLCLLDISGSLLSLQNSAITIVITAVNTCSPLPAVVNTVFFFLGGGVRDHSVPSSALLSGPVLLLPSNRED